MAADAVGIGVSRRRKGLRYVVVKETRGMKHRSWNVVGYLPRCIKCVNGKVLYCAVLYGTVDGNDDEARNRTDGFEFCKRSTITYLL
jgi:hypothetical protein